MRIEHELLARSLVEVLVAGGTGWHAGDTALVDVLAHGDGSATVSRVRDAAHQVGPGVRVGGIVAQNSDFVSAVYGRFPLMIILIAALTFVLLARAFRSLLLPLKGGRAQCDQCRRRLGCAHPRLAAGLGVGRSLGDRGDGVDSLLAPAPR